MNDVALLTDRFEQHRSRLRAIAYRMLGSLSEADDAVQETWLRARGTDVDEIDNLTAWLTTVVARICLNMLRSRTARREEPLDVRVPDPIVDAASGLDPEHEAILADAVGLALLVVLDTLTPAERVAFVLHDMFAVPFDDIAAMIDRSPASTRQLASRARRRVQGQAPAPDPDPGQQRTVVDAFFAASRNGDLDALLAVLDPDIVIRSDGGLTRAGLTGVQRGALTIAGQVMSGARFAPFVRPALVNGAAGAVVSAAGRVLAVMAFTVVHGKIVAVDVLYDPERLATIDLSRVPSGDGD